MDENQWKVLIAKLETSMIPDHTEGVVELLKMLKAEIDELKKRVTYGA